VARCSVAVPSPSPHGRSGGGWISYWPTGVGDDGTNVGCAVSSAADHDTATASGVRASSATMALPDAWCWARAAASCCLAAASPAAWAAAVCASCSGVAVTVSPQVLVGGAGHLAVGVGCASSSLRYTSSPVQAAHPHEGPLARWAHRVNASRIRVPKFRSRSSGRLFGSTSTVSGSPASQRVAGPDRGAGRIRGLDERHPVTCRRPRRSRRLEQNRYLRGRWHTLMQQVSQSGISGCGEVVAPGLGVLGGEGG
jgi:hypothetical protein